MRLFIDIDNTLIYSYRKEVKGEKICVEYINGRIQSYMTTRTYDYFTNQNKYDIIPVSTRTVPQYSRLSELTDKLGVRYAVVCNGGILLDRGEPDKTWLDETYRLIGRTSHELEKAAEFMEKLSSREVHRTEGIMIYTVTDDPDYVKQQMKEKTKDSGLTVFSDNKKVYCVPSVINKGNAVKRCIERFGKSRSVSAGDGIQDIPMLEAADIAIAEPHIFGILQNSGKICGDTSEMFSDSVCDILEQKLK